MNRERIHPTTPGSWSASRRCRAGRWSLLGAGGWRWAWCWRRWGVRREPSRAPARCCSGPCALLRRAWRRSSSCSSPGIRHLQVARVKNRVAVLVDRSRVAWASRSSPAGRRRAAAGGRRFLERVAPGLDGAAGSLSGRGATASTRSSRRSRPRRSRTSRRAAGTHRSARRAARGGGGRRRAAAGSSPGVLLFSDGADNAELAGGRRRGRRARRSRTWACPVSTFLVGEDGAEGPRGGAGEGRRLRLRAQLDHAWRWRSTAAGFEGQRRPGGAAARGHRRWRRKTVHLEQRRTTCSRCPSPSPRTRPAASSTRWRVPVFPGRGGDREQHPLLRAQGDPRPRARAAGGGPAVAGTSASCAGCCARTPTWTWSRFYILRTLSRRHRAS